MSLYIIGVGVLGTSQLTREGLRAMKQARKVLFNQTNESVRAARAAAAKASP